VTEPAAPPVLGLAHVASCSFLASRLAPSGQFFIALGGGVALARAGQRHGLRAGYGASVAAMVQTVALIGPARFNAPLTQALNAPVLGRLIGRGAPRAAQLAAVLGIRLLHYAVLNVLFVAIVVGGLDEYVATYDKVAGFLRVLPEGQTAAVVLTIVGAVLYGLAFSTIQVLVSGRALRRWPEEPPEAAAQAQRREHRSKRVWVAPGLVAAAWAAMLVELSWPVLAVVAGVFALLSVATRARRAGRTTWTVGLALAAVLALGALVPALIGAVDLEPAAQRAARAALLVMTATWARAFAGADGLREVARRTLWGVRRLPAAAEAARITELLESDRQLMPAANALVERFRDVETKPRPLADALTEWVAGEARGYRPPAAP
jgi:hypothetical protein